MDPPGVVRQIKGVLLVLSYAQIKRKNVGVKIVTCCLLEALYLRKVYLHSWEEQLPVVALVRWLPCI